MDLDLEKLFESSERLMAELLSDEEKEDMLKSMQTLDFEKLVKTIEDAKLRAKAMKDIETVNTIESLKRELIAIRNAIAEKQRRNQQKMMGDKT